VDGREWAGERRMSLLSSNRDTSSEAIEVEIREGNEYDIDVDTELVTEIGIEGDERRGKGVTSVVEVEGMIDIRTSWDKLLKSAYEAVSVDVAVGAAVEVVAVVVDVTVAVAVGWG
jgi:hypothetical protein